MMLEPFRKIDNMCLLVSGHMSAPVYLLGPAVTCKAQHVIFLLPRVEQVVWAFQLQENRLEFQLASVGEAVL